MEFTVPDTLVLQIREFDLDTNRLDTTLFVLYDQRTDRYVIRGNRKEVPRIDPCIYSFECESARDLADFIEFVIDKTNKISYILYNYDNLPEESNEITYDMLLAEADVSREISGYDNQRLKRKRLLKNIRMLRNIFNEY